LERRPASWLAHASPSCPVVPAPASDPVVPKPSPASHYSSNLRKRLAARLADCSTLRLLRRSSYCELTCIALQTPLRIAPAPVPPTNSSRTAPKAPTFFVRLQYPKIHFPFPKPYVFPFYAWSETVRSSAKAQTWSSGSSQHACSAPKPACPTNKHPLSMQKTMQGHAPNRRLQVRSAP
jgi:hypothetical protein